MMTRLVIEFMTSAVVSEREIRRSEVWFLINSDFSPCPTYASRRISSFIIAFQRSDSLCSKHKDCGLAWVNPIFCDWNRVIKEHQIHGELKSSLLFFPQSNLYFSYGSVLCAFYKDLSFMAISNPQWKDVMGLIEKMCSQLEAAQESTRWVSVWHFFQRNCVIVLFPWRAWFVFLCELLN